MKCGCGFCMNPECADYGKGNYILVGPTDAPRTRYLCAEPGCHAEGFIEYEHAEWTPELGAFREVRVEYDFEPDGRVYKAVGIVLDNDRPIGRTYTYFTPLIRHKKRALYLAEKFLGLLQQGVDPLDVAPGGSLETVVSFDEATTVLQQKLRAWESRRVA